MDTPSQITHLNENIKLLEALRDNVSGEVIALQEEVKELQDKGRQQQVETFFNDGGFEKHTSLTLEYVEYTGTEMLDVVISGPYNFTHHRSEMMILDWGLSNVYMNGDLVCIGFRDARSFGKFVSKYKLSSSSFSINDVTLENLNKKVDSKFEEINAQFAKWRDMKAFQRIMEHVAIEKPARASDGSHFSYGSGEGFALHSSAEDARKAAEYHLDDEREAANDYAWSDSVTSICWGIVLQSAQMSSLTVKPEDFCMWDEAKQSDWMSDNNFNPSFDEMCTYELMAPAPISIQKRD